MVDFFRAQGTVNEGHSLRGTKLAFSLHNISTVKLAECNSTGWYQRPR